MEVVVRGNCYIDGKLVECSIGVRDGKIAEIGNDLDGDDYFDFGSKLIIPGAVDAHVHMREPGSTHKEDFATGSMAALHGGVTCFLDMPNTRPPTMSLSDLRDKAALAASKSYADYGLFAGVGQGIDVEGLAQGAVGFKLYMASTTGDLLVTSLESVADEIRRIAATGKALAVHAEDEALRRREPESSLAHHLRNRRNECETSAIRKLRGLGVKGLKVHVCHVSAKESVQMVSNVSGLSSEVTPHHLLMDVDSRLGAFAKVNPPLRRREDRQALFQALKSGVFDMISSDHAPHTVEEKEEDFDFAPCGMPGVETSLPMMMQLVREKHVALKTLVRCLCERPAEVYGLNKGRIRVGSDADLAVFDMMAGTEIKADRLHYKCAWTPFEGASAVFPKAVFLRGEIMIEDGSFIGERRGRDVIEGRTR